MSFSDHTHAFLWSEFFDFFLSTALWCGQQKVEIQMKWDLAKKSNARLKDWMDIFRVWGWLWRSQNLGGYWRFLCLFLTWNVLKRFGLYEYFLHSIEPLFMKESIIHNYLNCNRGVKVQDCDARFQFWFLNHVKYDSKTIKPVAMRFEYRFQMASSCRTKVTGSNTL